MGRVKPNDPNQRKGPYLRALEWTAQQRPYTWFLVNIGGKVDPVLMKISGGRLKTTLTAPTVLLTHTGAKSGKVRKTPLAYFTQGDDVVLMAGNPRETFEVALACMHCCWLLVPLNSHCVSA